MNNDEIKVCWGTPDDIYYIDENDEYHEINLEDTYKAYTFGIWDGEFIYDNSDNEINSMIHDGFLPYYIWYNGWNSVNYRNIVSPKEFGFDFDDFEDEYIRYYGEDEDTRIVKSVEYYIDYSEDDSDDFFAGVITYADGDEEEFEYREYDLDYLDISEDVIDDIKYKKGKSLEGNSYYIEYEDRLTYGELMNQLGSPEARGRYFCDYDDNGRDTHSFIAFWWDEKLTKEQLNKIISKTGRWVKNFYYITEISQEKALEKYGEYNMPRFGDFISGTIKVKSSKEKEELFNIHTLPAAEKMQTKQMTNYRDAKNQMIGQRMTNYDDNGNFKSETPLANYNYYKRYNMGDGRIINGKLIEKIIRTEIMKLL